MRGWNRAAPGPPHHEQGRRAEDVDHTQRCHERLGGVGHDREDRDRERRLAGRLDQQHGSSVRRGEERDQSDGQHPRGTQGRRNDSRDIGRQRHPVDGRHLGPRRRDGAELLIARRVATGRKRRASSRRRSTGFAARGQTMTEPCSLSAPGQELRATGGREKSMITPVSSTPRSLVSRPAHMASAVPSAARRGQLSSRRSTCSPPSVTLPTRRGREGRTEELELLGRRVAGVT